MRASLSIGSKVLGTLLHGAQPGSVATGAARAATAEPQALPARYPSRLNCVLKSQGTARLDGPHALDSQRLSAA